MYWMTPMKWYSRAVGVTPGGSQTRSKAPGRVGPPDVTAPFPLVARRAYGAYIELAVGGPTLLLDFAGANAAVPLGYTPFSRAQLRGDLCACTPILSLPTELEVEVAEALRAVVPCARAGGMVRFVKTGSEACTAALLLARRHTGRRVVYVGDWAYHGWHEWAALRAASVDVEEYRLNDPGLLERLPRHPGAAVFFEPPRFAAVYRPWLEALRGVCAETGAVLVFDEMVAGFRLARGGGQEYYGVTPDLACFGKALANGFPLAAVVGTPAVMAHAAEVVSGTFGGDTVALAAARAVLERHASGDVIAQLWRVGRLFWETFNEAARGAAVLEGTPVHWRFVLPGDNSAARRGAVCAAAARRGVLFHRDANNASVAMTDHEVCRGAVVLADAVRGEVGDD